MKEKTEKDYINKLREVFPEIDFLKVESAEASLIYRQTICALTSVYWLVGEQFEAFTRQQRPMENDEKLSESSWGKMLKLVESLGDQQLDVVMVCLVLRALSQIQKFREQLAPRARTSDEVLLQVVDQCPKVLPSYVRLRAGPQAVVRQCLAKDFDFSQFVHAENIPASLENVKEILRDHEARDCYTAVVFAEAAGSMGHVSQEGSLFMTEGSFTIWNAAIQAWRSQQDGDDIDVSDLYERMLEKRAEFCWRIQDGIPRSLSLGIDRAKLRLACMAKIADGKGYLDVERAFTELDSSERVTLAKYLNTDGIKEKPGFILCGCPAFLHCARANSQVGLAPAIKIMLRIYEESAKEFRGSSQAVITIQMGKLTGFARDFFGAVHFQDLQFSLERHHETEALVVPKVWIPVNDEQNLRDLGEKSKALAAGILNKQVNEENFRKEITRIFPELNYFDSASLVQRDQTVAAMLSVYWLLSDNHKAFIREQDRSDELSNQSWAWIQDWLTTSVKVSTPEVVDGMMVFMAIHALGKIKDFRSEFAQGCSAAMHDIALATVLSSRPQVVPSFKRLPQVYQQWILDSLSVDFQFSQFLQGENTPLALKMIKERMLKHGDDGIGFFCFRIFAQTCGKLGNKSLRGSVFMSEAQFTRFKPGLEALMELRTQDAVETYNNFVLMRGSKAMSRFASPEHQALSRLLMLSECYDAKAGHQVCEAFDKLKDEDPTKFGALTKWLISDSSRKGECSYLLLDAPVLLQNARANPEVGLLAALYMLVEVQKICSSDPLESNQVRAIVNLRAVAEWAKDAGARRGKFLQAQLTVRSSCQADTKIFSLEVDRPHPPAGALPEESLTNNEARPEQTRSCRPLGRTRTLLLVALVACWSLALCFMFSQSVSDKLLLGESRSLRIPVSILLVLAALALVVLLILHVVWQTDGYHQQDPESPNEIGPREPFLRFDAWGLNPRSLSRNGRHQYSRLHTEDDDTV